MPNSYKLIFTIIVLLAAESAGAVEPMEFCIKENLSCVKCDNHQCCLNIESGFGGGCYQLKKTENNHEKTWFAFAMLAADLPPESLSRSNPAKRLRPQNIETCNHDKSWCMKCTQKECCHQGQCEKRENPYRLIRNEVCIEGKNSCVRCDEDKCCLSRGRDKDACIPQKMTTSEDGDRLLFHLLRIAVDWPSSRTLLENGFGSRAPSEIEACNLGKTWCMKCDSKQCCYKNQCEVRMDLYNFMRTESALPVNSHGCGSFVKIETRNPICGYNGLSIPNKGTFSCSTQWSPEEKKCVVSLDYRYCKVVNCDIEYDLGWGL